MATEARESETDATPTRFEAADDQQAHELQSEHEGQSRTLSAADPTHWFERDPLWFKRAVFYEIHLRGFYDGNDDGSGDFVGLTEKLDYLQWLGVDCIWLLPMFPSPLRDGGYDIADFYGIHPDYGTVEDFENFILAAHERGIRVIADLVMNHTSSDHQWFQDARNAPAGSPEREMYVWSDTDEKYADARIIFTDTETSNWTWDPVAGQYFWHRFFSHQPDLNYDNPVVHEKMLDVLRFWLDRGLDGFRLDAVPYLYEREGTNCENLEETHEFLRKVRATVDEEYPDRVLLAEANQWPEDVVEYYGKGEGDECHMAFHFPVMPRMFMSLRREDATPMAEILERTPAIPHTAQWGLFLRNHDELTLEMVTDEERDYMYQAYAADPQMRVNASKENLSGKGGYILKKNFESGTPDLVLMATGSEVSIAAEAYEKLAGSSIKVQLVSMPCIEFFEKQTDDYKKTILGPKGAKRIVVEAAIRQPWDKYMEPTDIFIGMKGFGESAPYQKLYEHFGITAMEWRMLVMLCKEPGISVSAASPVSGYDKGAVSRSLHSLEAQKLAEGRVEGTNSRNKLWHLTRKGKQLHDRVLEAAMERQQQLLHGMSADEVKQFNDLLQRFLRNLDALEG